MVVTRISKAKADGSVEVVLEFTQEQLGALVNVAMVTLLQTGMMVFHEEEEKSKMKEYLVALDSADMPQA